MTGTERAALRLALGTLRWSVRYCARGRPESMEVAAWIALRDVRALPHGGRIPSFDPGRTHRPESRLLRARLALYLRAVLRAEAGEEWRGYVSWSPRWREEFRTERWPTSDCYERVRLAVPLWSQAPGRKA